MNRLHAFLAIIIQFFFVTVLVGCAFDVSHLKQKPASFAPSTEQDSFRLVKGAKIGLGTGYPTLLNANTHWKQIGVLPEGLVYTTRDQIVKVEASNISEAAIVVRGRELVGFYLLYERTFSPLSKAVPLELEKTPLPSK